MMMKHVDLYFKEVERERSVSTTEGAREEHELISAHVLAKEKVDFFPKGSVEEMWRFHHGQEPSQGAAEIPLPPGINIGALQEMLSTAVGTCIKYHRKKWSIDNCPDVRFLFGEPIRTRLIAAFLRVADGMHVDRSRVTEPEYQMLDLPHTARLHWLQSFVVSSIFENPATKSITINFDIPDEWDRSHEEAKWYTMARRFFSLIRNHVEEEVYSVNSVFAEAKFPIYQFVNYKIDRVPGVPQDRRHSLWGVLCGVDLSFAKSSSSRLSIFAKAACSLIRVIRRGRGPRTEDARKEFNALINKIDKENKEERWCHFGLWNVIEWYKAITESTDDDLHWEKAETLFTNVHEYQENIGQFYGDASSSIYHQPWAESIRGADAVVVFSRSLTVVSALKGLGLEAKPGFEIVVLEGSPRSRFMGRDALVYHDGLIYANDFRAEGFERVSLYPDIAIGSVLEGFQKRDAKVIVAVGANGINPKTKTCFHALGHTTLVKVADAYGVHVVLFAETLKIACKPRTGKESPGDRTDSWLFSQIGETVGQFRRMVTLRNPRESEMSVGMIKWIVTEQGDVKEILERPDADDLAPTPEWMREKQWLHDMKA
jgi:hypothetical protein